MTQLNDTITRERTQQIQLLREINAQADMVSPIKRSPKLGELFKLMQVGDSVFLAGYTANYADPDSRLKCLSMRSYSRKGNIVWGMRSTQENGIKGVRVYREA